jgi:hypothetical protein
MTQREYGVPPPPNTQQMLMQLIAEETDRWTAILSERNIRPLQ